MCSYFGFISTSFFPQVNALLCSLDIDSEIQAKGPLPGKLWEMEKYWNESLGTQKDTVHPEGKWISEYRQHEAGHTDPDVWVLSFEQQHGASGWASEFERVSQL